MVFVSVRPRAVRPHPRIRKQPHRCDPLPLFSRAAIPSRSKRFSRSRDPLRSASSALLDRAPIPFLIASAATSAVASAATSSPVAASAQTLVSSTVATAAASSPMAAHRDPILPNAAKALAGGRARPLSELAGHAHAAALRCPASRCLALPPRGGSTNLAWSGGRHTFRQREPPASLLAERHADVSLMRATPHKYATRS